MFGVKNVKSEIKSMFSEYGKENDLTDANVRKNFKHFLRDNGYSKRTIDRAYSEWVADGVLTGLDNIKNGVILDDGYNLNDEPKSKLPFEVPKIPDYDIPLEDLLKQVKDRFEMRKKHEDAIKLVNIKVNTVGPIILAVQGDPHLDDDNCDHTSLQRDVKLMQDNSDIVFALNIGDLHNHWSYRLERLYSKQDITSKQAWKLVYWLLDSVNWLAVILGNHDCWQEGSSIILKHMEDRNCLVLPHGVRIGLQHPNGTTTKISARHDFSGHSQFNLLHGLKKNNLFSYRDHLVVAGHRHVGADASDFNADQATQLLRVSSYKINDDFAKEKGFYPSPFHKTGCVIINPDLSDSERGRCWVAPDLESGIAYVRMLRKQQGYD